MAPDVTVSQALLLTAVLGGDGSSVVTVTTPVVPLGLALEEEGLMPRPPASWVITSVAVVPGDGVTVIVAARLVPFGFPATE